MKLLRLAVVVALVVAGVRLYTAWPPINVVETGRTPEYPDLQPRRYRDSVDRVVSAVSAAVTHLARWTSSGSGSGPAGTAIHAVRTTRLFRFKDDVDIRVSGENGATIVSVRSASRIGRRDFGQNARNILELFAALDARLERLPEER